MGSNTHGGAAGPGTGGVPQPEAPDVGDGGVAQPEASDCGDGGWLGASETGGEQALLSQLRALLILLLIFGMAAARGARRREAAADRSWKQKALRGNKRGSCPPCLPSQYVRT